MVGFRRRFERPRSRCPLSPRHVERWLLRLHPTRLVAAPHRRHAEGADGGRLTIAIDRLVTRYVERLLRSHHHRHLPRRSDPDTHRCTGSTDLRRRNQAPRLWLDRCLREWQAPAELHPERQQHLQKQIISIVDLGRVQSGTLVIKTPNAGRTYVDGIGPSRA